MRYYKLISLFLAIVFALVGLIFLIMPNSVLIFFNDISEHLGMLQSPIQGVNFYLVLAVGYMYLVTLLAYFMYCYPQDRRFALLLANGKFASSILSLYFFLMLQPYLIYIANCIIDGFIGFLVLFFYLKMKKVKA